MTRYFLYLVVQVSADLSELAVPLDDILDAGALHEVGVLAVSIHHLLQALGVTGYEHLVGMCYVHESEFNYYSLVGRRKSVTFLPLQIFRLCNYFEDLLHGMSISLSYFVAKLGQN